MEPTQPESKPFAKGVEVEIDDGSGAIRAGTVLRATADSYHVDTADGPIWCGANQVFEPGSRSTPSEPPLPDSPAEPGDETADRPKRRAKKTR